MIQKYIYRAYFIFYFTMIHTTHAIVSRTLIETLIEKSVLFFLISLRYFAIFSRLSKIDNYHRVSKLLFLKYSIDNVCYIEDDEFLYFIRG